MKLLNNKDFIVKFDNKLIIYDSEKLKEIYMNKTENITSIALSENNLYFGCGDGSIYSFNLYSFDKTLVGNHSKSICSLFLLDNFLYSSSSDGTINKYIVSDLVDSSSNEDTTYRLVKSFKHSTPIHDVISDGEDILVSDMRNKVTLYPSNKIYDMESPLFMYKSYIFASEKNVLYCKTRQALASYIKTDSKIVEYKFNEDGGILFIRLFDRIQIYDFNKKELLKEINKFFDSFVYEENSNRLVGFLGKEMLIIDEVLEENQLKMVSGGMGCVKFDDMKIHEKSVRILEDEEYEVNRLHEKNKVKYNLIKDNTSYGSKIDLENKNSKEIKDNTRRKEIVKKREGQKEYKNNSLILKEEKLKKQKPSKIIFESDYEISENEYMSDTEKLESLFDNPKLFNEEVIKKKDEFLEAKIKIYNILPVKTEDCWLFDYNDKGYLRSIKSSKANKIELIFHDTRRKSIEIDDDKGCIRGSFYEDNIIVSSNTNVYFYGRNNVWNKLIFNRHVAINSKYILVHNEITTIFDFEGQELFNFYIKDITSISFFSDFIAVFSRKLTIINLFKTTEECYLPDKVTWSCFDKKGYLWCKIRDDIYLLYKKLTCKVFSNIDIPLSIVGENLVCLSNKTNLLPVPYLDFKKIPQHIINLLEDENVNSVIGKEDSLVGNTVEKENKFVNKASVTDNSKIKLESISSKVTEDSLSDDFDIFSEKHDTPTKKFNPLSDL